MADDVEAPMLVRSTLAGGFLRANSAFVERVGYSVAELESRPFLKWIESEGRARVEWALAAGDGCCEVVHETRCGAGLPLRIQVRKSGEEATVLARCASVQNPLHFKEVDEDEDNVRGTLHTIARIVEDENPGYRCSILLVDEGKFVKGAGPSLPANYNDAIDGFAVGPKVGSCGTAIFWNVPVIVNDIQQDPLWAPFRELAREAGVAACWSHPFVSRSGKVLGAIALYAPEPGPPTPEQLSRLRAAARMTGLAVERGRAEDALRKSEGQARRQAQLLRRANETVRAQTQALLESAEIDARNRELEALSKHKSEFLSSMSHELRTPLNAMIGYTALTLRNLREKVDAADLQNLESANRASTALLRLINDVLDFSKIEAGQMEVYIEDSVDLDEAIGDALHIARGLERAAGVELAVEVEEGLPPIRTDEGRFVQILNNLLSNAVKATAEGSVVIRARRAENERVRIEIEDTGVGIPSSELEKIFESFKQVDTSTRRRIAGTGLGLTITRHLCELLDVQIGVGSEVGVGTKFWLLVPVSSAETPGPQREPEFLTRPQLQDRWILKFTPGQRARVLFQGRAEVEEALRRGLQDPLQVQPLSKAALADPSPIWAVVVEASAAEVLPDLVRWKRAPALRSVPVLYWSPTSESKTPALLTEWLPIEADSEEVSRAVDALARGSRGEAWLVASNPDRMWSTTDVLEEIGFAVTSFRSPDQVARGLPRLAPKLLVLELPPGEVAGLDLLDLLAQDKNLARVPVLVLGASETSQVAREEIEDWQAGRASPSLDLQTQVAGLMASIRQGQAREVLLVDDNDLNLSLAATILRSEGYRVRTASRASEGIEMARAQRPHVVLMDLAMPGMDGFEATRALRALPETQDACIIACTAFAQGDHQDQAALAGCDGYLTKPYRPRWLIDQVSTTVLHQHLTRLSGSLPH